MKEASDDYREAIADSYTLLDAVRAAIDAARKRIEEGKDEARRHRPEHGRGTFNGVLSDADLADRAIVDMIDGMPALAEEEDTRTNS